jgi:hypothetical protein
MLQNCPNRRNKENENAKLQRNSYAAIATQEEHNQKYPAKTETTATHSSDTGDKTEQAPQTMTHTETQSTDIMMRECRDPSPIATKTETNTTEKRDEKTTDKRSRRTWAEEGKDEEDINSPEITHEDEDRHKQDNDKTQPSQCTVFKEPISESEKEDNSMEIVDSNETTTNPKTLKRKKKMKIEKSCGPQHEQTRSSTRRTTLKLRKI